MQQQACATVKFKHGQTRESFTNSLDKRLRLLRVVVLFFVVFWQDSLLSLPLCPSRQSYMLESLSKILGSDGQLRVPEGWQ